MRFVFYKKNSVLKIFIRKGNFCITILSSLFIFNLKANAIENYPVDTNVISRLLTFMTDSVSSKILYNPSKYRLQIIYTQVNRDSACYPHFKTFYYRHLPDEYFYPASTVKMPLSVFALEKLNKIRNPKIDRNTRIRFFKSWNCQTAFDYDKISPDGYATISNFISKALIVSDNESYNRLYEFTGQKFINKRLRQTVNRKARIVHRFNQCTEKENMHTSAFEFETYSNQKIYFRPQVNHRKYKKPLKNMKVGNAYYDSKGKLIHQAKDFSTRNYIPLDGLHEILRKIIFPCNFPRKEQFHLSSIDYQFLIGQLGSWPDESEIPALKDTSKYYRTMTNFLYYGNNKNIQVDSNLRIINIAGQAYGFLTDCAYFIDHVNNVEFFLSATIYVNEDGILNDDVYEYQSLGLPFLANLGRIFYNYESARKKDYCLTIPEYFIDYSR